MQALGRYELREQIGAGGMGTVYRAWDPRLDRDVAIKIVRLEHFSDSAQRSHMARRFETEARAAARLKHANIVAVHDFGEEQGQAFLVMELAPGKDLRKTLRASPGVALPVNQVLRILRECASALDHAHALGVVHRDVKPANLLVLGDGSVKLSDFGIARIATMSGLTMTGQTLGTPHYMAPEAVDPREDRPIDGRSDQFSLAVMAYELVMGRRPFEGDTFVALSLKILQETPDNVDLEPVEAAVELSRIFRRGLAKNAAERYPSCRALVAEIEAACRRVQAFPPPPLSADPVEQEPPPDPIEPVAQRASEEDKATRISVPREAAGVGLGGGPGDGFGLERSEVRDQRGEPARARLTPPEPEPKPAKLPPAEAAANPSVPHAGVRGRAKWIAAAAVVAMAVALFAWSRSGPSNPPPVAKSKPVERQTPPGMVLVSGGEARLGLDGMQTQTVPFYIDRTEVTNGEWRKFCEATSRDCNRWAQADAALPVVNVSFDEAAEYATWAGKRLPTWIEWERAARGSGGRTFPWGNEFREAAANLHRAGAEPGQLERADAHPESASANGTLNQVGNAWEWVASTAVPSEAMFASMSASRAFASLSPPLAKTERFYQARGGSFRSPSSPKALPNLLTDWTPIPGRVRQDDIGFRCVKDF